MGVTEELIAHWEEHKRSEAIYSVKGTLVRARNHLMAAIGAVELVESSDNYEDVAVVIKDEVTAILEVCSRSVTALQEHTAFLDGMPPVGGEE